MLQHVCFCAYCSSPQRPALTWARRPPEGLQCSIALVQALIWDLKASRLPTSAACIRVGLIPLVCGHVWASTYRCILHAMCPLGFEQQGQHRSGRHIGQAAFAPAADEVCKSGFKIVSGCAVHVPTRSMRNAAPCFHLCLQPGFRIKHWAQHGRLCTMKHRSACTFKPGMAC